MKWVHPCFRRLWPGQLDPQPNLSWAFASMETKSGPFINIINKYWLSNFDVQIIMLDVLDVLWTSLIHEEGGAEALFLWTILWIKNKYINLYLSQLLRCITEGREQSVRPVSEWRKPHLCWQFNFKRKQNRRDI